MTQDSQEIQSAECATVEKDRCRCWAMPSGLTTGLIAIISILSIYALIHFGYAVMAVLKSNLNAVFIYLFVAVLYALPAYGLFRLNRYARMFQLVASLFMVITGVIKVFGGSRVDGSVNVILHSLIAIYLLSDTCQRIFKSKKVVVEEVEV